MRLVFDRWPHDASSPRIERRRRGAWVSIGAIAVLAVVVAVLVVGRVGEGSDRVTVSQDENRRDPAARGAVSSSTSTTVTTAALAALVPQTTPTAPVTTVTEAPTTTILPEPDMVFGRVVDSAGQPVARVWIYVGQSFLASAVTDEDGLYRLPCTGQAAAVYGVGPKYYTAATPAENWQFTIVGGGTDLATAAPPACNTAEPVTTVVVPGGIITGTVYGADGNPASGTGESNDIHTDLPGVSPDTAELNVFLPPGETRYFLVGLPPGDYTLWSAMRDPQGVKYTVRVDAGATVTVDWDPDGVR